MATVSNISRDMARAKQVKGDSKMKPVNALYDSLIFDEK